MYEKHIKIVMVVVLISAILLMGPIFINNVSLAPPKILQKQADIVVSEFSVKSLCESLCTISMSVRVVNQGISPSGDFVLTFADLKEDFVIDSVSVLSLPPKESRFFSVEYVGRDVGKEYYLGVVADSGNNVLELDERNNQISKLVRT